MGTPQSDALDKSSHQVDAHAGSWEELSDERLLDALARGFTGAMEPFYRRHSRLLFSLIYHMVNNYEVATDLVQEAFVLIWRHAGSYSPQAGSIQAWITTIAHRHTIDYLRKMRRRTPYKELDLEEVEWEEESPLPDVWEEIWDNEQRQRVREALLHLSPEQRLVITLAFFHGLTHVEIAQRCGLPPGTVKSRLRLGLQHLKKLLAI